VLKVHKEEYHLQGQQGLKVLKVDKDFLEPKEREDHLALEVQRVLKVHKVLEVQMDQQELKER
jgi:hypothetical protein